MMMIEWHSEEKIIQNTSSILLQICANLYIDKRKRSFDIVISYP